MQLLRLDVKEESFCRALQDLGIAGTTQSGGSMPPGREDAQATPGLEERSPASCWPEALQ